MSNTYIILIDNQKDWIDVQSILIEKLNFEWSDTGRGIWMPTDIGLRRFFPAYITTLDDNIIKKIWVSRTPRNDYITALQFIRKYKLSKIKNE